MTSQKVMQDYYNNLHLEVESKYLAEIHDLHTIASCTKSIFITHDMLSDVEKEMERMMRRKERSDFILANLALRQGIVDQNVTSLWPSGIDSRLGRNRLGVRLLAVSDIYSMFIEPTITWVPSGFSGYIWLDTKIVLKKKKKRYPHSV